MEKTMILCCLQ